MIARIGSIVVNCRDLDAMTEFWSRALDHRPSSLEPDDEFRVLRGEHVNLSLQRARTDVVARDQMHLDLYVGGPDAATALEAEVRRLTGLGATWVREDRDPEDTYVVLADPEGNEFCLCLVD